MSSSEESTTLEIVDAKNEQTNQESKCKRAGKLFLMFVDFIFNTFVISGWNYSKENYGPIEDSVWTLFAVILILEFVYEGLNLGVFFKSNQHIHHIIHEEMKGNIKYGKVVAYALYYLFGTSFLTILHISSQLVGNVVMLFVFGWNLVGKFNIITYSVGLFFIIVFVIIAFVINVIVESFVHYFKYGNFNID